MPMPIIPVPKFPAVPRLPGVPPVLRSGVPFVTNTLQALSDTLGLGLLPPGAGDWGIFNNDGERVLSWDSVVTFDFLKEYKIGTYPIEEGAFETYNKVETPSEPKLTVTKGGSVNDRARFLATIENMVRSLDVYTVVTPEVIYESVNLTHFDYARNATRGPTLITVTLFFQQVRVFATQKFMSTKEITGESSVNNGTIQIRGLPETFNPFALTNTLSQIRVP